jgi:phosphohistidine phosphatase
MKTLVVMRHAKSSWDDASVADVDRPLNGRGRAAAPFMGGLLAREGVIPDIVISSPARRARETAELVKKAAGTGIEIRFDERIYEADPQTLVRVVSEVGEEFSTPMIVGHNPGMEGLVRFLTGSPEEMPTAAVAVIDIQVLSWASLGAGTGKVERVYRPNAEMNREVGA